MAIKAEVSEATMTITLDRPEARNSMNEALGLGLVGAFEEAARREDVRVVVLQGHPDFFCTGADVKEVAAKPPSGGDAPPLKVFRAILNCHKPILTLVSGTAIGAGATIPFLGDIIYAAENAMMTFPFTGLGLCPEAGSSATLARSIGYHRAAELLLFGEPLNAQSAYDLGLINRVLPLSESFGFVQERARRLASRSHASVMATKSLMRSWDDAALRAQIENEFAILEKLFVAPDAQEAFNALMERRRPIFA